MMADSNGAENGNSNNDGDDASGQKQAACFECRKSKVKCVRGPGDATCKRCRNTGSECVIPEYHVGRYKGVKNKRSGLEKAIHQVEQAIKRARTGSSSIDEEQAEAIHRLLGEKKGVPTPPKSVLATNHRHSLSIGQSATSPGDLNADAVFARQASPTAEPRQVSFAQHDNDEVTVNNADNPLQLLAIASAIPESRNIASTPSTVARSSHAHEGGDVFEDDAIGDFFTPLASSLDNSPDLDPIEQGLADMEEADMLFAYFHNHLSHTRWGLDDNIHTAAFVRSRSAYLFTSILYASSLFISSTGALCKRLENHCKHLTQRVISQKFRSTEIVLAFMMNIPWMVPGKRWAQDDETCFYMATALTIALDLSLNKVVSPSTTALPNGMLDKVVKSDGIDVKRALELEGLPDLQPDSMLARRILRTRERVWLALFNLDRGVCLARGRISTVPCGALVENCDAWHISDTAITWDGSLVAATVLRRDLDTLVTNTRVTCDKTQFNVGDGSASVKSMKERIEGFFENWYKTWSFQIQMPNGKLPPYVEILVSHGKLSAYCNVINHPTASAEVKQFFRAAGLSCALNVMRVAIQSESRLKSMPNNTVIMVSFAACFVLGLSITRRGHQMYLAPNVQKSIEETAEALERIGSSPPHRRGASTLFGRHIKAIMRRHTLSSDGELFQSQSKPSQTFAESENNLVPPPYTLHASLGTVGESELPNYEMMTDDQLIEAIQNAKEGIDSVNAGLLTNENVFMDWLEWPNSTW